MLRTSLRPLLLAAALMLSFAAAGGDAPRPGARGERPPGRGVQRPPQRIRSIVAWKQVEGFDGQQEYHDEQGASWRKLDVSGLIKQVEFLQII